MSFASLIAIALAAAAVAAGTVVTLVQRRAKDAALLRAQAGALRALADSAPGGYYYWDALDGSERFSAGLAPSLGAQDAALTAFADLAPCFAAADYARLTALIGALHGDGSPFTARLAAAGGRREIAAEGRSVSDAGGRTLGFIVWLRDAAAMPGGGERSGPADGAAPDIAEPVPSAGDPKRHVSAHAGVLEQLGTPIAVWGPDRRLRFFNRAYAELFRLDEARLAAEPLQEDVLEWLREDRLIPEQADFQAYKRRFMDMYSTLIAPVEEFVHLPDGRSLRVRRSRHPLGGLMFSYEDVSAQLELERSRNTLAAVQRTTLDNLTQAVAVFGGDGRLKLWNRTYAELWGFGGEILAGEPHLAELLERIMPLVDALSDGIARDIEAMVERSLDRTARVSRLERTDGVVLDTASVPLPDGATLITFYDVTDRTRIERALRERTEALEEADALKSQFIANVSYELRTPLNTITGFSEILIDQFFGELNARQLEYVEGIFESSGYLLALINNMLDLATIEAGRMRIETEAFDIPAMAQSVMRLVEERATEKKLSMRMEVPPDIGSMEADERRIRQVIFNLLNNAIRFTEPGGTVMLGAERTGSAVAIWVSDTGQGIAAEDLSGVFDPFWRSGAAAADEPGSGLGLALVERFVELHGGRVELVSEPGRGTRATCVFPERAQVRRRLAAAEP